AILNVARQVEIVARTGASQVQSQLSSRPADIIGRAAAQPFLRSVRSVEDAAARPRARQGGERRNRGVNGAARKTQCRQQQRSLCNLEALHLGLHFQRICLQPSRLIAETAARFNVAVTLWPLLFPWIRLDARAIRTIRRKS